MDKVVRQTWDERFKMYMKLPKKELASMLAEQAKYISPDSCKEFEETQESGVITSMTSITYDEMEY